MKFPGKNQLPALGVGLSFRQEIAAAISEHVGELDFMEVILDNALHGVLDERFWNAVACRVPLVGHGVDISLGSLEPLDVSYVQSLNAMACKMGCKWFSDHLAFTHSGDVDVGQLMPIQFCEENAAFLARKIRDLSRRLDVPFLIENVAYLFEIPGSTLAEIDFLLAVIEAGRCGLLLDINNLYANSINHGYDPYAFIDRLPAEAVVEIHVAGGENRGGLYIDTHGHALRSEVLSLVDYVLATKRPKAVLLEREKNFPPMAELLGEVHELRRLWILHRCEAITATAVAV